jgi:hypothetical protein
VSNESGIIKGLTEVIKPRTKVGERIAELLLLGFGAIGLSIMSQWIPDPSMKKFVATAPIVFAFLIGIFMVFRLMDAIGDDIKPNVAPKKTDPPSPPSP